MNLPTLNNPNRNIMGSLATATMTRMTSAVVSSSAHSCNEQRAGIPYYGNPPLLPWGHGADIEYRGLRQNTFGKVFRADARGYLWPQDSGSQIPSAQAPMAQYSNAADNTQPEPAAQTKGRGDKSHTDPKQSHRREKEKNERKRSSGDKNGKGVAGRYPTTP